MCVDFGGWIGSQCSGGSIGVGNVGISGLSEHYARRGRRYFHWDGVLGVFWGCSFGEVQQGSPP